MTPDERRRQVETLAERRMASWQAATGDDWRNAEAAAAKLAPGTAPDAAWEAVRPSVERLLAAARRVGGA